MKVVLSQKELIVLLKQLTGRAYPRDIRLTSEQHNVIIEAAISALKNALEDSYIAHLRGRSDAMSRRLPGSFERGARR